MRGDVSTKDSWCPESSGVFPYPSTDQIVKSFFHYTPLLNIKYFSFNIDKLLKIIYTRLYFSLDKDDEIVSYVILVD